MTLLTDEQLESFHERLLAAREAATTLLAQGQAEPSRVETSGGTIGRLTRIDAIQMQGMSQMSRAQLEVRLQQIEAALRKYDAGQYGTCNRCRGMIGLERLEALPEAPLCLRCQEELESGS